MEVAIWSIRMNDDTVKSYVAQIKAENKALKSYAKGPKITILQLIDFDTFTFPLSICTWNLSFLYQGYFKVEKKINLWYTLIFF